MKQKKGKEGKINSKVDVTAMMSALQEDLKDQTRKKSSWRKFTYSMWSLRIDTY